MPVLTDADVAIPLWDWPASWALAVLSERRRRGILQHDPEPIGDAEYA